MRPGQNKRMRGRNGNRKGPNPLTRTYESNGPDVKIRGTAHHVAEKYLQLARDAQSSGDPVMAESYLQHAEHYFRIIAAAQQAQQQGQMGYIRQPGEVEIDEDDDDDESAIPDRFASPPPGFGQPGYGAPNGPQPQYSPPPQPQAQNYSERPSFNPDRQGQDRPYQDRGPRQDRPYQDRNNQNRNNQNRGPRDQRQQRDFRNDQPRGDFPRQDFPRQDLPRQDLPRGEQPRVEQPRGEAPRSDVRAETRQPIAEKEGAALPAFITAPVRLPASEEASESPHLNGSEPEQAEVGGEAGGFHLRPRRRRRGRPAIVESGTSAANETGDETDFPGELPLGD
jgi:hypothetical protein